MEVIVIIVFAILAIIEGRKERRDPTYRSWMDNGSAKTFHRPGQDDNDGSHWDHWNHKKYGD